MLVFLSACLTPSNFTEREYHAACVQSEKCDAEGFSERYDSVDDCVNAQLGIYAAAAQCRVETCTFDDAQAKQCLGDLEAADCEALADGSAWADCGDVWKDCDETEYADCIGTD